jgi:hypothetical protein
MRLPQDSEIRPEKITDYLLKPRTRNDKSKFLAELGYSTENWQALQADIRTQILTSEAGLDEKTPFGDMYKIEASLTGPNGKTRKVLTFWMFNVILNTAHLVTMYPAKGDE